MSNILIAYETGEGHTADIAHRIAEVAQAKGHTVETIDVKHIPFNYSLDKFDAFIFGASIHLGKYPVEIKSFIRTYKDFIEKYPSAFFSVCLTAANPDAEAKNQVEQYISTFLTELDWQPQVVGSFGGALLYTSYGFFKKNLMKQISQKTGLGTNTTRDYDYTDWEAVNKFVEDFLNPIEALPPTITA